MKSNKTRTYFIEIIKNKRKGFLAMLVRFFFRIASCFYRLAVNVRNWIFDQGWLRRFSPPVPLVISIGNIVAGGTGKTPTTLLVANQFYKEFSLAILSRGYRSKAEHQPKPICLCNGKGPLHPAAFCGDEPFLLAQNLPKSFIYVGKDRQMSSIFAAQAGAKLILLDDGMQYRKLVRDIDIVVMDNNDLFGQGHYLPRGFLREGITSLKRAHMIVINHLENEDQLHTAQAKLAPYSQAPVVGTNVKTMAIWTFNGEKIPSLQDKKVGLFCGIAHPEYFKKNVEKEGALVVAESYIGDHEAFNLQALENFAVHAQKMGAELLICTEKDRVKFSKPVKLALPIAWLQVELKVVAGTYAWNKFIQKAKNDILRRI